MQIPVFASENAAEVKIPVVQVVENEAKDQAEEFSYVLTTNQSEAPMPKGSKENQYCWSMKKKETVEISIPVTTRGIYHYQIYQTKVIHWMKIKLLHLRFKRGHHQGQMQVHL
ncbi:hypothetical protein [Mediterraneibacter faecis]|nr:hypothetical protein [Mediterraneibacter faecis]